MTSRIKKEARVFLFGLPATGKTTMLAALWMLSDKKRQKCADNDYFLEIVKTLDQKDKLKGNPPIEPPRLFDLIIEKCRLSFYEYAGEHVSAWLAAAPKGKPAGVTVGLIKSDLLVVLVDSLELSRSKDIKGVLDNSGYFALEEYWDKYMKVGKKRKNLLIFCTRSDLIPRDERDRVKIELEKVLSHGHSAPGIVEVVSVFQGWENAAGQVLPPNEQQASVSYLAPKAGLDGGTVFRLIESRIKESGGGILPTIRKILLFALGAGAIVLAGYVASKSINGSGKKVAPSPSPSPSPASVRESSRAGTPVPKIPARASSPVRVQAPLPPVASPLPPEVPPGPVVLKGQDSGYYLELLRDNRLAMKDRSRAVSYYCEAWLRDNPRSKPPDLAGLPEDTSVEVRDKLEKLKREKIQAALGDAEIAALRAYSIQDYESGIFSAISAARECEDWSSLQTEQDGYKKIIETLTGKWVDDVLEQTKTESAVRLPRGELSNQLGDALVKEVQKRASNWEKYLKGAEKLPADTLREDIGRCASDSRGYSAVKAVVTMPDPDPYASIFVKTYQAYAMALLAENLGSATISADVYKRVGEKLNDLLQVRTYPPIPPSLRTELTTLASYCARVARDDYQFTLDPELTVKDSDWPAGFSEPIDIKSLNISLNDVTSYCSAGYEELSRGETWCLSGFEGTRYWKFGHGLSASYEFRVKRLTVARRNLTYSVAWDDPECEQCPPGVKIYSMEKAITAKVYPEGQEGKAKWLLRFSLKLNPKIIEPEMRTVPQLLREYLKSRR